MFFFKSYFKYLFPLVFAIIFILAIHTFFINEAKVIRSYSEENYQDVINLLEKKENSVLKDKDLSYMYVKSLLKLGKTDEAVHFLNRYRKSGDNDEQMDYLYRISKILDICSYYIKQKGILKTIRAYQIEPVINDNYNDILEFYRISSMVESSNQLFLHNRNIIISNTISISENRTELMLDLLSLDYPELLNIVLSNIKHDEIGFFSEQISEIHDSGRDVDKTLLLELIKNIKGYDIQKLIKKAADENAEDPEMLSSLAKIMAGLDYGFVKKYIDIFISSVDIRLKSAGIILLRHYIPENGEAFDLFVKLLSNSEYDPVLFGLYRTILVNLEEEARLLILKKWESLHEDIKEVFALLSVIGKDRSATDYIRREKGLKWRLWEQLTGNNGLESTEAISGENEEIQVVFLISIDTLRRDHLELYGYKRNTFPRITEIAKRRGLVFSNFYSNSSWTLPSHVSMLSGLSPVDHGINGLNDIIDENENCISGFLKERGFITLAFVTHSFVSQKHNFHKGFDFFYYNQEEDSALIIQKAESVMDYIIKNGLSRKLFVFIHIYDCHSPYTPVDKFDIFKSLPPHFIKDNEYINGQQNLYDGEILYVDSNLSSLMAKMDNISEAVYFISSDHGEEFLEHKGVLHGTTLYREVVEVPFIVIGNTEYTSGLAQYKDMFLVNQDTPFLILKALDVEQDTFLLSEDTVEMLLFNGNIAKYSYIEDYKKLYYDISRDKFSVFDLRKDIMELKPINIEKYPKMKEKAVNRMEAYIETELPVQLEMTEEQLEMLKALGYIS